MAGLYPEFRKLSPKVTGGLIRMREETFRDAKVPAGTFMAYKVEPIMKSEGIFKSKGRLII